MEESSIYEVCLSHDGFYKYKNIYSKFHALFLVFYSYPEYSKLSIKITLSTTHCMPVSINIYSFQLFYKTLGNVLGEKMIENMKDIYKESSIYHLGFDDIIEDYLRFSIKIGKCFILEMNHGVKPLTNIENAKHCELEELKHVDISDPGRLIHYRVKGFLNGTLFSNIFTSNCFTLVIYLLESV